MKSSWIPVAALVLTCMPLAACDKPNNASDSPSAASSVTLSDEDIPVAEDFITKATEEVKEDNYAAELDKLEKEINAGN